MDLGADMKVSVVSKKDWTLGGIGGKQLYRKGSFYWITADTDGAFFVKGEDGEVRPYDKYKGDGNYYGRYFVIVPV